VTSTTVPGRPIPHLELAGGKIRKYFFDSLSLFFLIFTYRNVPTYVKFVVIDGLQTCCECTVDTQRVIGLDVIHRYLHTIDYRKANPRVWTRRPDLVDELALSVADESDSGV
jgi:hypothetical protein